MVQTWDSGAAMANLPDPKLSNNWVTWALELIRVLNAPVVNNPPQLPVYSIATLPKAAQEGLLIYVTDAIDGPLVAYSDGTDWRNIMDQEVIE